jgi:tripartite-type tricarboxylate transporter receptor subunit TctC
MWITPCPSTVIAAVALSLVVTAATAQHDFPSKPIRYITPYAPGGSTSFTARLIGQKLTEAWGQQVIVDNRPGANTMIGMSVAAKSRPDGYTIISMGNVMATNHLLFKTPYDLIRDFTPIATILSYENVMVVPPSLGVATVKEFVALAKAKPAELTYGTSASGGSTHLLAELFNVQTGIRTRQIPYKGGGPAVADLMGGHISFFMSNPANVSTQIRNGRLKALAVTGESRVGAFPDVPTFAEEGLPGMTMTNWQGVGGPAGIPKPIVQKLTDEVRRIVAMADTKEKLNAQGFEPFYNGPQKTAELINTDIARYGKIIREANIKVE